MKTNVLFGAANKERWRLMRRTVPLLLSRAATLAVLMAVTLVVAGGVALALNKVGTNGPDTLSGTNKSDFLSGRDGGDDIYGLGGTDNLQGGPGKDFLFGGRCADFRSDGSCADFRISSGNKNLVGGTANDYLNGGLGSDNIAGQEGDDLLWGGTYRDTTIDVLSGGEGNDAFFVAREEPAAKKDIVSCGDGRDQVLADRADVLRGKCERVVVVHGSQEDIERQIDNFYNNQPLQKFFRGIRWPGL
jgi:Ca2+-binding RTX toxin-like protein